MQTVEYHIKLPKHLSVRLEDQIIERYGYRARGGITLLILEALEEKLNPTNATKVKTQKNELVHYNTSSPSVLVGQTHSSTKKAKVDSDIYRILREIFRRYGDANKILDTNLRSIIIELFAVKDERAVTNYINLLKAKKIINVDTDSLPVIRYNILVTNTTDKELLALK